MVVTRVHRIGAVLGLIVLIALLAGCNVTTRVDVTMHADGSGVLKTTITVDGPTVQQMGGANALAQTVPLDDLKTAGWTISPWAHGTTGSESVVLSHPFVNQADLSRRIVDLAGQNGILQDPTLHTHAGLVQLARRVEHRRRRAFAVARHRARQDARRAICAPRASTPRCWNRRSRCS